MPLDTDEIALSENMEQALSSVLSLGPAAVGALRVASGATKGTLIIAQGYIVSANINGVEKTGVQAVEHLLRLDSAAFHFLEDQAITSNQLRQCRVSLYDLLNNKLSLEGLNVDPMSEEEVLSAEAMLAATFDKVNSAMSSGQGTPTMEIPDDVYKKFMDLLKADGPATGEAETNSVLDELAQGQAIATTELHAAAAVPPSLAPEDSAAVPAEHTEVVELQSETIVVQSPDPQPQLEATPAYLPNLSSWVSGSMSVASIAEEAAKEAEPVVESPPAADEAVFVNIAKLPQPSQSKIDPAAQSGGVPGVKPPLNQSPTLDYESLNSIPTPKVVVESVPNQTANVDVPAPAPALLPRALATADPNATSTRLSRISSTRESIEPGFIDRVQQAVSVAPKEPGPQGGGFGIGKILGPLALVALGAAIFVVPQSLQDRMSSLDTPALAEQRMTPVVDKAMVSVMPYPYLSPSSD